MTIATRLRRLEDRWREARVTVPGWRVREILAEVATPGFAGEVFDPTRRGPLAERLRQGHLTAEDRQAMDRLRWPGADPSDFVLELLRETER